MSRRRVGVASEPLLGATPGAAYIYVADGIARGEAAYTEPVETDRTSGIHLDFDKDGRLLGIEVLGASRVLPKDALRDVRKGPLARFANRFVKPS